MSYPADQVQDGVLSPAGGKDKGKADKKDKKDDKKKEEPKVSSCWNDILSQSDFDVVMATSIYYSHEY